MRPLAIALHDLRRTYRNPLALGLLLLLPLLMTGLVAFAFGGAAAQAPAPVALPPFRLAVVDQDQAGPELAAGRAIVSALTGSGRPAWLQTRLFFDESAARRAVVERQVDAALLIAPALSRALLAGQPIELTLVDGARSGPGRELFESMLSSLLARLAAPPLALAAVAAQARAHGVVIDRERRRALASEYASWAAAAEPSALPRPSLVTAAALGTTAPETTAAGAAPPGADLRRALARITAGMLTFFIFFGGASSAQSIVREAEEGTLGRLFTTPTPRATILAGKSLGVLAILSVQVVLLLASSALAFGIDWGAPLGLALLSLGLVVAAAGLGVCVVSFSKNLRQSGPLIGGVLTLSSLLGGLFTSALASPAFADLELLVPQGWALRGFRSLLNGASSGELVTTALVLLGMGLATFTLGALVFRRRFAGAA